MSGLLFVGLVFAVLFLSARLHEARTQLRQTRHERDVYAKIYEDGLCDLYRSTLPRNEVDR